MTAQPRNLSFRTLRRIYSTLWYAAVPLVLARLGWKGRKNPDYRRGWPERFGFGSSVSRHGSIWVHAVSVGEMAAIAPLVHGLFNDNREIVVTTTTPTGAAKARQLFGARASIRYIPFDTPGATRRFFRRTNPSIGVIVESEIWPNLLYAAWRNAVPVIFANARLSPGSVSGYRRARWLIVPVLATARLIAAQSDTDAERFLSLGMPADRVETIGNLKFDASLPSNARSEGNQLRQRLGRGTIILGASTHEGDESVILDAFNRVRNDTETARLLLAPRHPERREAITRVCSAYGFTVATISENTDALATADVVIGDQMGALTRYYCAADLAILGATFAPIGGHNPIEAVLAGCPVIIGPNHQRIADAIATFTEGFVVVQSGDELAKAIAHLTGDPAYRGHLAAHANAVLANKRGATKTLLSRIANLPDM